MLFKLLYVFAIIAAQQSFADVTRVAIIYQQYATCSILASFNHFDSKLIIKGLAVFINLHSAVPQDFIGNLNRGPVFSVHSAFHKDY